MLRIITQILIGLMLVFGALTLAPRAILYVRNKDVPRAVLFLLLVAASLFLALMAFNFAYVGIRELFA